MVVSFDVPRLGRFDQDVVGVEVRDGGIAERFQNEKAEDDHHYEGVTAERISMLFNSTIQSDRNLYSLLAKIGLTHT